MKATFSTSIVVSVNPITSIGVELLSPRVQEFLLSSLPQSGILAGTEATCPWH